jgi:hypothetical protein
MTGKRTQKRKDLISFSYKGHLGDFVSNHAAPNLMKMKLKLI